MGSDTIRSLVRHTSRVKVLLRKIFCCKSEYDPVQESRKTLQQRFTELPRETQLAALEELRKTRSLRNMDLGELMCRIKKNADARVAANSERDDRDVGRGRPTRL